MLTKIKIPAGISRESTEYEAGNRWYDCNNARFRGGVAESISGWSQDSDYILDGIGRSCFSTRDYSGNIYQFVATNWKFYVIVGGVPYDITGISPSNYLAPASVTSPFTTVSGSEFLKVTIVGHGRKVNNWINFYSVADVIDVNITGSILTQVAGFQVTEVEDLDNFYIRIVELLLRVVALKGAKLNISTEPNLGVTYQH